MGVVWAAAHLITERRVAIKIMKSAGGRPAARGRFLREARASSRIDHPSAVRVLDAFELHDGTPALVMDLLEGETLAARISGRRLSLEETAAVVVPIASVLAAAHARGIVHRDLKPDNVFLTKDPDPIRSVRVLDFGIAMLAQPDVDTSDLHTRPGALLGTPCYMAPEQACGEKDLDHRVDVWALGVIAYEALTGGRPYEADNVGQLVKRMLTDPVVPVEELVESVPPDVARLVARMLSRDREERPGDLTDVIAVFGRHAALPLPATKEARSESGELPTAVAVAKPLSASSGNGRRAGWLMACALVLVAAGWIALASRPSAPAIPASPTESAHAPAPSTEPPEPPGVEAASEATTAPLATEATAAPRLQPKPAPRAPMASTRPEPRMPAPAPATSPPPVSSRPGLVTEPPY